LNRIKEKRIGRGITQEFLANALSTDRSTVAKWETEKARPRADKLPELAKILGCTIDELFKDEQKAH